jgi:tRNA (pseudouridine54-N1)-methyltransferase
LRRFLVTGHTQKATGPIPLNDAAGAGRWDVLARSVAAAFLLSNGIRKDVEVYLALREAASPKVLRLRGAELMSLNPDERAILGLLSKALSTETVGEHWAKASPGLDVARWDLQRLLAHLAREGPLVLLHEHAPLLDDKEQARHIASATFVLSDHQEFSNDEMRLLATHANVRHSLGPLSLHTSSCIVIIHNWLDRL